MTKNETIEMLKRCVEKSIGQFPTNLISADLFLYALEDERSKDCGKYGHVCNECANDYL